MKPPARKRQRKSRELGTVPELPGRSACKWPVQEQRRLLTALTKLCPGGGGAEVSREPLPDPEKVLEYLPSRTPAEINSVLDTLKEKVVLFAKNRQRTERREERRDRRPLELWIHEASAASDEGAEGALSSAFYQLLAVASTEPCVPHSSTTTLSKGTPQAHSASPKLSRSPLLSKSPAATESGGKTTPPPHAPHPTDGSIPSSMCEVSFEKIYHYLSILHKPSEQCKLTPLESAVVLDLLMSLPEQLLDLDCEPLIHHVTQTYQALSSGAESSGTKEKTVKHQPPIASSDQQQPPTTPQEHLHSPQGDSSTQRTATGRQNSSLNPFLIPVSLMTRKARADQTT